MPSKKELIVAGTGRTPTWIRPVSALGVNGEHPFVGCNDKNGFLNQMRKMGFSFHEVGNSQTEKKILLQWPEREGDFSILRSIGVMLDDVDTPFSEFRQFLYEHPDKAMTIEGMLQTSPLFSNLYVVNGYRNQAESAPNIGHILKVLELFQEKETHSRLERWFVFMHDLGKAIPWRDTFHARIPTLIGQTFFYSENQRARRQGKSEIFDEEFISDFSVLCELHHIFEFILKHYSNPKVKQILDNQADKKNFSRESLFEEIGTFYLENNGKTCINFDTFFNDFHFFLEKPYLLGILIRFTRADVGSYEEFFNDPLYAKGKLYQAVNDVFMDEIEQYCSGHGVSLD